MCSYEKFYGQDGRTLIKEYIFLSSLEDISSVYRPDSVVEKGVDEQHFVVHFCCTSVKGI